MQTFTLVALFAVVAMALAEGQFYVPRAYYTIDSEGHASAPVPLRRLRRSVYPYPYQNGGAGGVANANANAYANGNPRGYGDATANANANANANAGGDYGGWGPRPTGSYSASNPNLLRY